MTWHGNVCRAADGSMCASSSPVPAPTVPCNYARCSLVARISLTYHYGSHFSNYLNSDRLRAEAEAAGTAGCPVDLNPLKGCQSDRQGPQSRSEERQCVWFPGSPAICQFLLSWGDSEESLAVDQMACLYANEYCQSIPGKILSSL